MTLFIACYHPKIDSVDDFLYTSYFVLNHSFQIRVTSYSHLTLRHYKSTICLRTFSHLANSNNVKGFREPIRID